MIALVEGAQRQKTPNEIALSILLAGLTIIFLIAVATLAPFAIYARPASPSSGLDRAARVSHSDDDRRPALRYRHRRHGPRDAAQRARDERARGRSRGRCRYVAARQDGNDHAGQPPGDGIRDRRTASTGAELADARASLFASPTRRRKAVRSWCWRSKDGLQRTRSCRRDRSCRSARTRA